jgi:hypothetical protein
MRAASDEGEPASIWFWTAQTGAGRESVDMIGSQWANGSGGGGCGIMSRKRRGSCFLLHL